jgi:hypothetical protein
MQVDTRDAAGHCCVLAAIGPPRLPVAAAAAPRTGVLFGKARGVGVKDGPAEGGHDAVGVRHKHVPPLRVKIRRLVEAAGEVRRKVAPQIDPGAGAERRDGGCSVQGLPV